MRAFTAQSTDARWRPAFVEGADFVHKLATLDSLSVYWDSFDVDSAGCQLAARRRPVVPELHKLHTSTSMDQTALRGALSAGIEGAPSDATQVPTGHSYLIAPVTAEAKIVLNKKPVEYAKRPKTTVDLDLNAVDLSLRRQQARRGERARGPCLARARRGGPLPTRGAGRARAHGTVPGHADDGRAVCAPGGQRALSPVPARRPLCGACVALVEVRND